ncbi:MAG: hypothetical protein F4X92_09500 [Gammaproteobacteria bacterium]|nr:hypothetical protein [Gammaproteobacteria bacterium]
MRTLLQGILRLQRYRLFNVEIHQTGVVGWPVSVDQIPPSPDSRYRHRIGGDDVGKHVYPAASGKKRGLVDGRYLHPEKNIAIAPFGLHVHRGLA